MHQGWRVSASGFLPDRELHSFASQDRVGEPFLTQFFDAQKKLVVVFGVVMCEGQALHSGHFRKLHGLIEAAVSPAASFLQFLGRVLRVMDQQVRASSRECGTLLGQQLLFRCPEFLEFLGRVLRVMD